jgi:hypothetical protein
MLALLVPGCNRLFKKLASRVETLHSYGQAQNTAKAIGRNDLRLDRQGALVKLAIGT